MIKYHAMPSKADVNILLVLHSKRFFHHHWLLELPETHVHRVGDAIQPSHPLSSPSPPLPSILPSIRVFSNEPFHHYIIDEISNILSLMLFPILFLYLWPWSSLPPEKRQLLYQVYFLSSPVFLVVLCIDVSKNNINIVLHVFTFTLLHFAICLLVRWPHVNKYVPPSLTFTGW